jgi:ATP-binding cassette subfamily G (WHITE) protein 2 (SNQ2)
MDVQDIWRRNFVVLVAWVLFYQVTQIVVLDFLPVSVAYLSSLFELPTQVMKQNSGGTVFRLFAKETPETRKLNDRLRKRKASRLQARIDDEGNSMCIDLKRDNK